jgi:hypothetical protein
LITDLTACSNLTAYNPFSIGLRELSVSFKQETAMKVKVTTREFVRLLQAAKELDQQFPWLGQAIWLLNHSTGFADGYVTLNLPE